MKAATMLFSLLIAAQAVPVTMQCAAAQSEDMAAEMAQADVAARARFAPEWMRAAYGLAVGLKQQFAGKPTAYSYDTVMDVTLPLAGGNTVKSQYVTAFARASDGRTRTLETLSGVQRIIIADPTAQTVYMVCPERKEVLRMSGGALALPTGGTPAWQPPVPSATNAGTDLGEKTIAGVKVRGGASQTTIPAGAQGNDKPMVQESETWFSPELMTVMYMHMKSPQIGDTVIHVENLAFADVPDATFALPQGYAVRDVALANNPVK